MHVNVDPPTILSANMSPTITLQVYILRLTVVDVVGHTSSTLSIDITNVLLQARVRYTTRASGDRAVGVGAAIALREGSCTCCEGEDDRCSCESHSCGPSKDISFRSDGRDN
jgi:hypothetical protein